MGLVDLLQGNAFQLQTGLLNRWQVLQQALNDAEAVGVAAQIVIEHPVVVEGIHPYAAVYVQHAAIRQHDSDVVNLPPPVIEVRQIPRLALDDEVYGAAPAAQGFRSTGEAEVHQPADELDEGSWVDAGGRAATAQFRNVEPAAGKAKKSLRIIGQALGKDGLAREAEGIAGVA